MPLPHYQISERGTLDRRSFVVATSSLAAAALGSTRAIGAVTQRPKFSSYPFTLGVASGDPSPDGMFLRDNSSEGRESQWVGKSPSQLGIAAKPNLTDGKEISPKIRSRQLVSAAK